MKNKEDFAAPANKRLKIKEIEKIDKYLDLVRELKKLWKMKVTMIPIIGDVHVKVPEGLEKRIGENGSSCDYEDDNVKIG